MKKFLAVLLCLVMTVAAFSEMCIRDRSRSAGYGNIPGRGGKGDSRQGKCEQHGRGEQESKFPFHGDFLLFEA